MASQTQTGRKKETYISIAPDRTPDELAFRRDDIGAFLIRMGDSNNKRVASPLPSDSFPMLGNEEKIQDQEAAVLPVVSHSDDADDYDKPKE